MCPADHANLTPVATPSATTPIIDPHAALRDDVRLLGGLLGDTLKEQAGQHLYDQVEAIRLLGKKAAEGDESAHQALNQVLSGLQDDDLLPIARAFTQFLNLANIAEQYHRVRRRRAWQWHEHKRDEQFGSLYELLPRLKANGLSAAQIAQTVRELDIELVLTAHPTEVSRRTLIQKYDDIAEHLERLDHVKQSPVERRAALAQLKRTIIGAWHTDEIRHHKPTPVDEAKWGFTAIEQTLWFAMPEFLRQFDQVLFEQTGEHLPLDHTPIRFASWMGGDRDGNPNVTHAVTEEVLLLARWQAADLFWRDVDALRWELSMEQCSAEMRAVVGEHSREPYRDLLRQVRDRLGNTRDWAKSTLAAGHTMSENDIYLHSDALMQPLLLCHRSLVECNMAEVADGDLTDLIRRVACFGVELLRLDIRQESGRHRQTIAAITEYLGLGDYQDWDEASRQQFLLAELQQKRPLLPNTLNAEPSLSINDADVAEVLATFKVLAAQTGGGLGAYVISMAEYPSDVLSVMLLQKEAGVQTPLRVVPLFETLKDLESAGACLDALLSVDWYKQAIHGRQEIMIGYSDSAKDAGFLAASWAQYRAQEALTAVAAKHGVKLTLFHGRGGSVSRGGAPTHQALMSQPPNAVQGSIRVTEQGEMIRFKFGMKGIAMRNLELYAAATLEATLLPPPPAKPAWRELMDRMSQTAVNTYRQTVREEPAFIRYLRTVTPELELQMLPLGSRPARRQSTGGLSSLRAIPWVFAWTQIRLMLPAWLGTGRALKTAMDDGNADTMQQMLAAWPYFQTVIDMLEMVLSKADANIAAYYEAHLTQDSALQALGEQLRRRLLHTIDILLNVVGREHLLQNNPVLARSIAVRTPYVLPLHMLQAELMRRRRQFDQAEQRADSTPYDHALMVTIAGIAAGLRNTG